VPKWPLVADSIPQFARKLASDGPTFYKPPGSPFRALHPMVPRSSVPNVLGRQKREILSVTLTRKEYVMILFINKDTYNIKHFYITSSLII
jgi:hypothetical protein